LANKINEQLLITDPISANNLIYGLETKKEKEKREREAKKKLLYEINKIIKNN
jgi:hypothetical protein